MVQTLDVLVTGPDGGVVESCMYACQ